MVRGKYNGKPKAYEDYPNVFNAGIRKRALDVAFDYRIQDANQGRCRACDNQEYPPPSIIRRGPGARKIKDSPHQPVNSHLYHYCGHQGRDVAWRRRMRLWKPRVEWDNACLCSKSQECKYKHQTFYQEWK